MIEVLPHRRPCARADLEALVAELDPAAHRRRVGQRALALLLGPAEELHEPIDEGALLGPFAADALFYYVLRGDYDAVVAMYHDQGLVPLKMIAFERGVNWTLGLPFVRTSPDHGTAFDIAGKNIANPSSMIEAIRLAKKLAQR